MLRTKIAKIAKTAVKKINLNSDLTSTNPQIKFKNYLPITIIKKSDIT